MAEMISETVIPACEGRAFEVLTGQVLRVIAHEGKQVGDLYFVHLHNFKERFDVNLTVSANNRQLLTAKYLSTNPPFYRTAFTVEHDQYGYNWLHGRCNPKFYERRGILEHRNCQANITEALAPYGIAEPDIATDTFNVFMAGSTDERGQYSFHAPHVQAGDYIDLRAHMDALVAISACPSDDEINDFLPKPLKVQVWQGLEVP